MTEHVARGDSAFKNRDYDAAVVHFSEALKQSPGAAKWLTKRSAAYQRIGKHDDALQDAEAAVIVAKKRAVRELIAEAQLRRAIALFGLSRFGDALFLLDVVEKLTPSEKSLTMWKAQVRAKLSSLQPSDTKATITVKEDPEPAPVSSAQPPIATSQPAPAAPAQPAPARTPANKVRHDWYQTADTITITILARGVPKDAATVEISERSVSISFPTEGDSTYDFSLDPLFAPVDTSKSSYNIYPTKIELVLRKSNSSKWSALEQSEALSSDSAVKVAPSQVDAGTKGPSYPTSSKTGPKNWEQIAKSFVKPKSSGVGGGQEQNDVQAKDAVFVDEDEDDVGDPANAFFSRLYAGSDDDTRRAMMKSYQESGGTALSTNWGEVSKGRVPVTPPEGMEERTYER